MADELNKDCNAPPDLTFAVDKAKDYTPPEHDCISTVDYTTSPCADSDSKYLGNLVGEVMQAGAGAVNLFPMLGVHNQGSLLDIAQDGWPISSGTPAGFNVLAPFKDDEGYWVSTQYGSSVLTDPAFLGYDFGTVKAWVKEGVSGNAAERYQRPAPNRRRISQVVLKQSDNALQRVTRLRVEARDSDDQSWNRVDVIVVPDVSAQVTIKLRDNIAAYRQWRLVPILFNGVASSESWGVQRLQLLEATQVAVTNLQDPILMENRNRAYAKTSVMLKCQYDHVDSQTDLAKFGINLPETWSFTVHFDTMVEKLGRPVIVGDMLEVPSLVQYDHNLKPVRKWLEVSDTSWSNEGFLVNWKPTLFKFTAAPVNPSVEHRDLLGLPQTKKAATDDQFLNDSFFLNVQASEVTEIIKQEAASAVPQTGADKQDLHTIGDKTSKLGNAKDIFVQDAIPPDGAEYTIGDHLPKPEDIEDGHYHRQTFSYLPIKKRPPERLLHWSSSKGRWSVVSINTRKTYESHKPTESSILGSTTKVDIDFKP